MQLGFSDNWFRISLFILRGGRGLFCEGMSKNIYTKIEYTDELIFNIIYFVVLACVDCRIIEIYPNLSLN